ncbi:TPM domain-containing protein [Sinomicrobium pectinilyticum]|uniref:TPM domain-containing protein n=2 Tax=Sinomicrobium pectinilyticum TaxID=1084421 RepID=A0A3N0E290_SINP1|nr:TPM domain-containing protein [Sinomicrobium pectinilyticum]
MRNFFRLYMKPLLYGVFLFAIMYPGYGQYTIQNIPSPKLQGQDYFVSNPDGVLSFYAADSVNAIAVEIERQTTAEFAIVVVDDFSGQDDFNFAFELFNTWEIGKKENDNGLLLFIAKDRRVYRFITGYGMEGILPDALLRRIGERYLVPHFKEHDYDAGVLEATGVIRDVLLYPDKAEELRMEMRKESFFYRNRMVFVDIAFIFLVFLALMKWTEYVIEKKILKGKRHAKARLNLTSIMGGCGCMTGLFFAGVFITLFMDLSPGFLFRMEMVPWYLIITGSIVLTIKYFNGSKVIVKSFRDEKNRLNALAEYHKRMWVPLIFSPVALFSVLGYQKRKRSMEERFLPPDNSGNWDRLDRDELKKKTELLDEGQLKEEWALSRSYEIWKHKISGDIKVIGWDGIKAKDYSACPSCHYHTFKQPHTKTIRAATYQASGKGERIRECVYCGNTISLGTVVIPRKQRSSSSSSSGGGGYSGGSSSGSFGGGSSGGGGAGGSW